MTKLIPKKQMAWETLQYNGPQYWEVMESLKKEDPQAYNRLQIANARSLQPNSEIIHYKDANGNNRTASINIGMSAADPIGEFVVGNAVLNPAIKLIGRGALWGMGRTGNKWARAKIISNELNNSMKEVVPIITPKLTPRIKQKRLLKENDSAPTYIGKTYEINDIVNPDGTVNIKAANQILKDIAKLYGGIDMQHRLENPTWHKEDPNTFLHTKLVTKRAYDMPTPKGFTKQDLVFAALGHDFGKIFAGDGHGRIGADMLKLVFPNMSDDIYKAITGHMGKANESRNALARYTKFADIGLKPPQIEVSNPYIRLNPTLQYANEAISIYPKNKPNQYFQLIKDNKTSGLKINPNGEYSVHFKTDRFNLLPEEKEEMFDILESQIPLGAKISTWGKLTKGGYSGLDRFGKQYGYLKVGTRLKDIPVYLKPHKQASYFINNNSEGEPLYMPNMEVFNKGKDMAVKFFNHPVVKESNKHNLELAKRFGINIPDRNPSEVVSKPINVLLSGANDNSYAEIYQAFYDDPNAVIKYNYMPMTKNQLQLATIHENLHRGYYSTAPRISSMSVDYYNNQYKPELNFYKWKDRKLLKPEHYDGYLGDYVGGELGPNLIDLGRELGLKLGLKYPGYDLVKNMLDNYKGYKKFIIPLLNDTKAGMRHVWDAMTGKYFTLPLIIGQTKKGEPK